MLQAWPAAIRQRASSSITIGIRMRFAPVMETLLGLQSRASRDEAREGGFAGTLLPLGHRPELRLFDLDLAPPVTPPL